MTGLGFTFEYVVYYLGPVGAGTKSICKYPPKAHLSLAANLMEFQQWINDNNKAQCEHESTPHHIYYATGN